MGRKKEPPPLVRPASLTDVEARALLGGQDYPNAWLHTMVMMLERGRYKTFTVGVREPDDRPKDPRRWVVTFLDLQEDFSVWYCMAEDAAALLLVQQRARPAHAATVFDVAERVAVEQAEAARVQTLRDHNELLGRYRKLSRILTALSECVAAGQDVRLTSKAFAVDLTMREGVGAP